MNDPSTEIDSDWVQYLNHANEFHQSCTLYPVD